ncbi:MAG: hypothetical protein MUC97_10990, partial [Bernardetiaceae bacterium]|nr:hypothetical protein [Bernardetiaceae bacterium]
MTTSATSLGHPPLRTVLLTVLGFGVPALLLSVANANGWLALPEGFLAGFRWLALVMLMYYGYRRANLTTWIVVAMFVGGEVGHDFPEVAKNLKVLSDIFIRL